MSAQLKTIIPVWTAVALGAIVTGLFAARGDYFGWLAIVMAGGILLTFCIQLAIDRKEGLVSRVTVSFGGAIVILAAATVVLGLIAIA